MFGIIASIVAGATMSVQGVINTRLNEKIGLYEANVFVQGTAFLVGLAALWIMGKGQFSAIGEVNKIYLLGGVLGFIITVAVMLAIGSLSPTYAIAVILISQLFVAASIDAFGILGTEKVAFTMNKWVGVLLMVGGVIAFEWKG